MQSFSVLIFVSVVLNIAVNAQESNSLLPQECGKLNEDYLHNGEETTKFDEFPWIAQLLFKNETTNKTIARCGAVLISKRHLLAPAQCFVLKTLLHVEPTTIVLGKWRADDKSDCIDNICAAEPRIYDIDEIAMHPNYNEQSQSHFNAIAVIRLSDEVTFGDTIQPICLPSSETINTDFVAQYLDFSGFDRRSRLKKKTALHVRCMNSCRERFAVDKLNVSDYNMCTGGNTRFRAFTGSPLMGTTVQNSEPHSLFLVSLYLARGTNELSTSPDLFLKVAPFLSWIKQNLV